jgi:predicted  nucleic acid-binding Zn-ribbon protein
MTLLLNWRIWAAIGLFGAGWAVNGWRINSEFSDYKMAAEMASKAAIEQARETEHKWNEKLNQERDNAAKREQAIRADLSNARSTIGGLRNEMSATSRRISEAPSSSCPDAAATIGELLTQCSEQYLDMAEKAQRHISDVKTLIESWPH